jgi:hypothetical protein
MLSRISLSVLVLSLVFLPACGKGGANSRVSGKVKYAGAPVTGGTIVFQGKEGGERYNSGIKGDGTYTITNITPGDYTVIIETESINPNASRPKEGYGGQAVSPAQQQLEMMKKQGMAPDATDGGPPITYVKIPAKYASDKSGLEYTVKKGKNEKDFDLTD